jgi:hypothetical protein
MGIVMHDGEAHPHSQLRWTFLRTMKRDTETDFKAYQRRDES